VIPRFTSALFLIASWIALAELPVKEPVFVGLVSGDKELSIGAYDPVEGWTFVDTIPSAPAIGAPLTVYGLDGRLGVVHVTGILRHSDLSRWNSLRVSAWTPGRAVPDFDRPVAAIVSGDHPAPRRIPTSIPDDDATTGAVVSAFLETKGLAVRSPVIKQALRIDLDGDGTEETLIAAEDFSALRDGRAGPAYSVALIRFVLNGESRTLPFAASARFKQESESQAAFQKRFGPAVRYRFLAFPDVEGKGRAAIFLAGDASYLMAAYVFTFDGAHVERVLFGKVIF